MSEHTLLVSKESVAGLEGAARKARMLELEKQGMTRSALGELFGMSRQRVSQLIGPLPRTKGRVEKRLFIDDDNYNAAAEVAKSVRLFIRHGDKAGEGSVARLIEQIGRGNLKVVWASEPHTDEEEPDDGDADSA